MVSHSALGLHSNEVYLFCSTLTITEPQNYTGFPVMKPVNRKQVKRIRGLRRQHRRSEFLLPGANPERGMHPIRSWTIKVKTPQFLPQSSQHLLFWMAHSGWSVVWPETPPTCATERQTSPLQTSVQCRPVECKIHRSMCGFGSPAHATQTAQTYVPPSIWSQPVLVCNLTYAPCMWRHLELSFFLPLHNPCFWGRNITWLQLPAQYPTKRKHKCRVYTC